MRPGLCAMFAWFGSLWNPPPLDADAEQAAIRDAGPPAGATSANAFIYFLRAGFEPLRAQTALNGPTTNRRFGQS
jgi:hypothetical protein